MLQVDKLALIWGLCQAIKKAGLPGEYIPVMAVILGMVIEVADFWNSGFIIQPLLQGALNGLVATGVVSMVDDRLKKLRQNGTE